MKVLYKSYMLTQDFLDLERGDLFVFDSDTKSFILNDREDSQTYLDREFILDNPSLFEPMDEDIVDFKLEPEDMGKVSETPNTDVVRENDQAKEYMGQFARALSVENLTEALNKLHEENLKQKEDNNMRNRQEIENRLTEVKAVIFVLEEQLQSAEEGTAIYEATELTLAGFRQQFHTLTWVLNN